VSEFTYPGVYIKEVSSGPGPISGVTTSNLGLIGFTTRGEVDYPVLCTSFTEFVTKFGSFTEKGLLPTMAYAFFQNGGQRLYVVRATHDDADNASWDYELDAVDEQLSVTADPAGHYELQVDHVPVTPGTATVTFENANPALVNAFADDGAGTMVHVLGTGTGGAGSIDYDSGEITIDLAVPGEYTGTPRRILADYTYRVLRFEMQWPGLVGNYFRVLITPGSDDYLTSSTASWSRFTITIQEDLNQDPTDRAWSTLETFSDVVFDDETSKNYIVTVMNDAINGSQYVTVTDYGNAQNPPELAGTAYLNENLYTYQQHSDGSSLVVPDPYDGVWKGWQYQLAHDVFPTTFVAEFRFIEHLTRIGTGTNPITAVPNLTWTPAALVAGSVLITANLTGGGPGSVLVDDGAGNLTYGGFGVGTITYTTGAIAIDLTPAADTFVVDSAVLIDCTYAQPVTVIDDGNGVLSIADPATLTPPVVGSPTKFELNTSGTNTIDYDTGEIVLTWKIAGDPAAGPAGTFTTATAASKTSTAGPWVLTPGCSFDLDANGLGAPATITFNATQGYLTESTVWGAGLLLDGLTTILDIGGTQRTVTFTPPLGGVWAVADAINAVNAQVPGAFASLDGVNMRVTSDVWGLNSTVAHVAGGTADALLDWLNPPVNGTGDVDDIEAVRADEYEALVEAGLPGVVVVDDNGDGTQTTRTLLTGATAELTFSNPVPAGTLTALGITAPLDVFGADSLTGGELADYYAEPDSSIEGLLTGGLDGSATDSDDIVSPLLAADMRGLYAFGKVDELMQLVAADFQTDPYVIDALLTYAELMKDKFVICAVPFGLEYQEAVTWKRFTLNRYSSFGAIYYPHIKVRDPITSTVVDVPPGGHVAGVYARTDSNKNVGKAPGGMEDGSLSWSQGLEYTLTQAQVGYCTENKINCLVEWPITGRVVWGVRSLDVAGGEWPYIQMRRLFMFVEKSVFNATHIHVFKNNGPPLWNAITTQLTNFLSGLYQGGYFAGSTPEEAFFVICNRSNNPQNTVDQGIVYCDVGIACNKPAEYICFRFSQRSIG